MPSKKSLQYRRMKIRTNFVPQITFCDIKAKIEDIPRIEELEVKEDPTELIPEEDPLFVDLVEDLKGIRRNAKRKLEGWIRDNKNSINSLQKIDQNNLLCFIQNKYYNR